VRRTEVHAERSPSRSAGHDRLTLARKRNSLDGRIQRLKEEVDDLASVLYNLRARDLRLRYQNLKTYRRELQRGFVLQLHLAVEDLSRALIFDVLAKLNRRTPKRRLVAVARALRSSDLIAWCQHLRVISQKEHTVLLDLNRIRNACAHHWILDVPLRPRRASTQRRPRLPVVIYNGRDLFNDRDCFDGFCRVSGGLYLKLLRRVWTVQGRL
jgi:hypothetical protein